MRSQRVIAIDGPSASGKSSTADAVARALGLIHLDSGALYRGLTRIALDFGETGAGLSTLDPRRLIAEAERRGLLLRDDQGSVHAWLDGRPAEDRIRTAEVTSGVSAVSAIPALRDWVNAQLRATAAAGAGAVVDGRDIGTVVFPDAALKVFLVASPAARARRRLGQRGEAIDPARLADETARLAARDDADSQRAVAPLTMAADALPLDGTDLTFQEQVAWIVKRGRSLGLGR
ncbi:MAG TPA: (d)CMP kinase [Gemmatimonadales bacterium]|nr:(d)CMP kinase [Gemmatimonadales bacterium]